MTNSHAKTGNFFVRQGWKVFLIISLIFGLFGFGDLMQGMDADPAIAESIIGATWEQTQTTSPEVAQLIDMQVRAGGVQLIVLSALSIVVCLLGYRRGQRWAWYALWIFPVWMVSTFLLYFTANRSLDMPPPPPMISAPIFFVITVFTLLLTYRYFFEEEHES